MDRLINPGRLFSGTPGRQPARLDARLDARPGFAMHRRRPDGGVDIEPLPDDPRRPTAIPVAQASRL